MHLTADSFVPHYWWKIEPVELQTRELERSSIQPQRSDDVATTPADRLERQSYLCAALAFADSDSETMIAKESA